jgi:haloalkane dehalogenase
MVPEWVDKGLYPWTPKEFDVDHKRMSYVDVGRGDPVVLVHGTPTWSFMYRAIIEGLSGGCRCIAPDNIGFGLSDKPAAYTYRPEKQAEYLSALIQHLELKNVTLVVHDFGGPIGLSYALDNPQNVKHLVVMNTWLWSLRGNANAERANRFIKGALGRFLYLKANFSAKHLMPYAIKDKSGWNSKVKRHYVSPFADPSKRTGPYGYARALLGSSVWFESLWNRRETLSQIPTLILWGMRDPFLSAEVMDRMCTIWPEAEVHRLKKTGHFVAEEHGADVVPYLDMLMHDTAFLPTSTVES